MANDLVRFSDRIYYLPGEEETDRPYLHYIRGDSFSVAIDAGNSRENTEEFYAALSAAGLSLPKYTLITHWHWDHTFGMPYIVGTSVSSEKTAQKLSEVAGWQWTKAAMRHRLETGEEIPFCNDCIEKVYPDLSKIRVALPDETVADTLTLDLGGVHARLLARDSIHSRDSLLVFVPEERALFVGDAHCADFYNGGAVDPDRVAAYHQLITSLDFENYFMGHDIPCSRAEILAELEQ